MTPLGVIRRFTRLAPLRLAAWPGPGAPPAPEDEGEAADRLGAGDGVGRAVLPLQAVRTVEAALGGD